MKLKLGIACGVLALGLVGCGESESDDPAASATPSSPTSSATASGEPSPTFDPKKETAKEFIRRWIRLDNEMQVSGDTEAYAAVVDQKCRACQDLIEIVDEAYSRGGWIRTKGMTVDSIERQIGSEWVVAVTAAPTKYRPSREASVQSFPGGPTAFALNIVRDDSGHWVVTNSTERPL